MKILFANGCWQDNKDMGDKDWKIYNDIIDDIVPKDMSTRHAHYYRDPNDDLPWFVKIHRGASIPGSFDQWFEIQPWFKALYIDTEFVNNYNQTHEKNANDFRKTDIDINHS